MSSMRVDMNNLTRFVSLEEAGLEEDDEHAHGIFHSNEGSIYSYTAWFYDGDESAFGIM